MARKKVERNIAYDDVKKKYYVYLDYGVEKGKQIKRTKTFDKQSEARRALKEHEADKTKGTLLKPKNMAVGEWLNYWMNDIIIPNRENTTVYGYKNMIDNHIIPELGSIQLQQFKPLRLQAYYTMLLREKGLSPKLYIV